MTKLMKTVQEVFLTNFQKTNGRQGQEMGIDGVKFGGHLGLCEPLGVFGSLEGGEGEL